MYPGALLPHISTTREAPCLANAFYTRPPAYTTLTRLTARAHIVVLAALVHARCPLSDSRVTRRVICGAGREGVITRDLRSHKICPRHPPRSATLKIHIPRWPLVPSSQVEKQTFMFERASIKGAQQRLSTQRNSLASGRRCGRRRPASTYRPTEARWSESPCCRSRRPPAGRPLC